MATLYDNIIILDLNVSSTFSLVGVRLQIGGGFIGGMISDYLLRGRRGVLFVAMMLPVAISFFFFNSADLHWLYFLIPFGAFSLLFNILFNVLLISSIHFFPPPPPPHTQRASW